MLQHNHTESYKQKTNCYKLLFMNNMLMVAVCNVKYKGQNIMVLFFSEFHQVFNYFNLFSYLWVQVAELKQQNSK